MAGKKIMRGCSEGNKRYIFVNTKGYIIIQKCGGRHITFEMIYLASTHKIIEKN